MFMNESMNPQQFWRSSNCMKREAITNSLGYTEASTIHQKKLNISNSQIISSQSQILPDAHG